MQSVGHSDVVTHPDSSFLHMFLLEHFKVLTPKPVQFLAVEMTEVASDGMSMKKPTSLHKPQAWCWANVKEANNKVLNKVTYEEKQLLTSSHIHNSSGACIIVPHSINIS